MTDASPQPGRRNAGIDGREITGSCDAPGSAGFLNSFQSQLEIKVSVRGPLIDFLLLVHFAGMLPVNGNRAQEHHLFDAGSRRGMQYVGGSLDVYRFELTRQPG